MIRCSRRRLWRVVRLITGVVAALVVLAGALGWVFGGVGNRAARTTTSASPVRPVGAAAPGCATALGPFRVAGTRLVGAGEKPYIPYGITLSGLERTHYERYTRHAAAKLTAIAHNWCSNTVRLQVSQSDLVGNAGTGFSPRYLRAVEKEVALAKARHLVVVLNDQTEEGGYQPAPTKATAVFWKDLARVYGHDPQVIFDLFNEPRNETGSRARDWRLWQRGGHYRGRRYLGMQALVDDVRSDGATNPLWVEGPDWADSLARVRTHRIVGGPIVYAIHHPTGAHTPAVWSRDFGYLVTRNIAPVVVGEWTNYASTRSECWDNGPGAAPRFLRYLRTHGIGLTAWTLRRGVLLASTSFTDPSRFGRNWACARGLDQGAGTLLRDYYRHANTRRVHVVTHLPRHQIASPHVRHRGVGHGS